MCSPKVDLGWWGGSGGIGIRDGRQFRFKLVIGHIETITYSEGNSSALAAANCDPDYGWINGPEGSNKCYMYLKVQPDFSVIVFFWKPFTTCRILWNQDNWSKSLKSGHRLFSMLSERRRWISWLQLWSGKTLIFLVTGNFYYCNQAKSWLSFWKSLRSIAGKPQLLHWLLRLLLLPGTYLQRRHEIIHV